MVMTEKRLRSICQHHNWPLNAELTEQVLAALGQEPTPYVYSEQDLFEQARKMILIYNNRMEPLALEEDF